MGSKKETGKDRTERLARIMRSRPSPSLAIGLAVFMAAVGTTAIVQAAGDQSGSSTSTTQAASSQATKSASVTKQLKKLSKRVAALEARSGVPGPQGPQGPAGPAGALADGSVTTSKLADHAVIGDKVAHDTLTGVNIDESTLTGVAPGGPAGGALADSYPNPVLHVTGGPCDNGQALTDISTLAALTCAPGVYTDENGNVGAGPGPFTGLASGFKNTSLGQATMESTGAGGDDNTAVGFRALQENDTGDGNSALGSRALRSNQTGTSNSALGQGALEFNISGSNNAAVGEGALSANNSGFNSALGNNALRTNVSGGGNTAVGESALFSSTISGNNTALGGNSLSAYNGAAGPPQGGQNTAVGRGAMANATGGAFNDALGFGALNGALTTAVNNVALGHGAGSNLSGADSNNIEIGNAGTAGDTNTIRIGSPPQDRAFIAGIRGRTTGNADAVPVLIDSAGQLGTVNSSRRFKQDIQPLGSLSDPLMKLRPVSFRYRSDPSSLEYGLIAEQVAKVMPNLAVYGKDGLPETVQYQDLPVLLLNKVQQQERRIARQQAQIDWLMSKVRGR